jgi:hypothetical protein
MINNSDYQYPVVLTKELLIKQQRDHLTSNKDKLVFDLGRRIEVFESFPPHNYIEEEYVLPFTKSLLLKAANAYKWLEEELLEKMLSGFADKIRKKSLGGIIPKNSYGSLVDEALINKDTIDLKPNSSVRFLTNPFYRFKEGEYEDRHTIRMQIINNILKHEKYEANYGTVHEAMAEYDLSDMKLTKKQLTKLTGLSYATIKNYLKIYPELREMYIAIRHHSGTAEQKKAHIYYLNRLKKSA